MFYKRDIKQVYITLEASLDNDVKIIFNRDDRNFLVKFRWYKKDTHLKHLVQDMYSGSDGYYKIIIDSVVEAADYYANLVEQIKELENES